MNKLISAILIILGIVLIIWGVRAYLANQSLTIINTVPDSIATSTASSTMATSTGAISATSTASTTETSSTNIQTWKSYTSIGGIVTLKYPSDWSLSGTTMTSPKGDMKIEASYAAGTLPACDPAVCTSMTVDGRTYNRIIEPSNNGITIIYMTPVSGFVVSAVATMPNDASQKANIALADEIMSTVKVK